MKNIFRTPTGIECGILYERPLPNLVESKDAQLIQRALLNKRPASIWTLINKMIGL